MSNVTLKESLRNLDKAYNNFYKGRAKLPKFKSKKKSNDTFYSRYDRIKFFENKTVNLEKIGKVKYKSSYDIDLTQITKLSNPNAIFNGRCWVLRFGIEIENKYIELTDKVLGIDLGIKQLAIVNEEGLNIPNINKIRVVKKLEKKLKKCKNNVQENMKIVKKEEVTIKLRTLKNLK